MLEEAWRIQLLGGLKAEGGGRSITRFRTHKTGTLLAYLAFHPHRDHPREELIERLWPEDDPVPARTKLRIALSSLRKQLEPPGVRAGSVLIADRATVRLNRAALTTDVEEFETCVNSESEKPPERIERLARAVERYRGDLLPGHYDDWIVAERERLAALYVRALTALIRASSQAGHLERAIGYAARLVAADPLHEKAHLVLIQLYAQAGRPAAARQQFAELERILRDDLGTEPTAEARKLLESIGGSDAPRRPRIVHPAHTRAETPPAAPASISDAEVPRRIPLQFNRFFGREQELSAIQGVLTTDPDRAERVITLMGPGGAGKTRLAIESAGRIAPEFDGPVCFVNLADVSRAEAIPAAITAAMMIPPQSHVHPIDQVVEALQDRRALLIMDNFEQLAARGGGIVGALLQRLPRLTMLITSRQRLGIQGERVHSVDTLPTPASHGTPERLMEFPSVQLFVDRAQSVRPDFQITRRNADSIAALCCRLEGIPLALELAAAWVGALTPAQMLEKLERRLDLLVGRDKGMTKRHRTMRAAIGWSFDLLSPALQRFFGRLSVFRGGWTPEAAEVVCQESDSLECLLRLRERSLIVSEESRDESMRFRMLETLREYATESLDQEEPESAARRHAGFYLGFAGVARLNVQSADQVAWLDRMEAEQYNLKAALDWCVARPDPSEAVDATDGAEVPVDLCGLRIATGMLWFYCARGEIREGISYMDAALARPGAKELTQDRANALKAAGILARRVGDYEKAGERYQECLEIYRAMGRTSDVAAVLANLGAVASNPEDYGAAIRYLDESLGMAEEGTSVQATALCNLGSVMHYLDRLEEAEDYFLRSMESHPERIPGFLVLVLNQLGDLARKQGRPGEARDYLDRCAELLSELREKNALALLIRSYGSLALADGGPTRAAIFYGTYESLRDRLDRPLAGNEERAHESEMNAARSSLGAEAYDAAILTGRSMSPEQALESARESILAQAKTLNRPKQVTILDS